MSSSASIKLDFFAKTSIPKVRIAQPEFNFGDIRFGNTGTLQMTIINEGNIDADLIIDLRDKEGVKELEGVDGLSIMAEKQPGDEEESFM